MNELYYDYSPRHKLEEDPFKYSQSSLQHAVKNQVCQIQITYAYTRPMTDHEIVESIAKLAIESFKNTDTLKDRKDKLSHLKSLIHLYTESNAKPMSIVEKISSLFYEGSTVKRAKIIENQIEQEFTLLSIFSHPNYIHSIHDKKIIEAIFAEGSWQKETRISVLWFDQIAKTLMLTIAIYEKDQSVKFEHMPMEIRCSYDEWLKDYKEQLDHYQVMDEPGIYLKNKIEIETHQNFYHPVSDTLNMKMECLSASKQFFKQFKCKQTEKMKEDNYETSWDLFLCHRNYHDRSQYTLTFAFLKDKAFFCDQIFIILSPEGTILIDQWLIRNLNEQSQKPTTFTSLTELIKKVLEIYQIRSDFDQSVKNLPHLQAIQAKSDTKNANYHVSLPIFSGTLTAGVSALMFYHFTKG